MSIAAITKRPAGSVGYGEIPLGVRLLGVEQPEIIFDSAVHRAVTRRVDQVLRRGERLVEIGALRFRRGGGRDRHGQHERQPRQQLYEPGFFRHLPVMRGNEVIGVLSVRDLMGALIVRHERLLRRLAEERLTLMYPDPSSY